MSSGEGFKRSTCWMASLILAEYGARSGTVPPRLEYWRRGSGRIISAALIACCGSSEGAALAEDSALGERGGRRSRGASVPSTLLACRLSDDIDAIDAIDAARGEGGGRCSRCADVDSVDEDELPDCNGGTVSACGLFLRRGFIGSKSAAGALPSPRGA